ncbi:unannotated protein [freshwater metagenome]|uniref:Unannotated protein n=1 Tax=freshwater metagenome TaxID=449393 RepID=A0A6J6WFC9_9ZZZZ
MISSLVAWLVIVIFAPIAFSKVAAKSGGLYAAQFETTKDCFVRSALGSRAPDASLDELEQALTSKSKPAAIELITIFLPRLLKTLCIYSSVSRPAKDLELPAGLLTRGLVNSDPKFSF